MFIGGVYSTRALEKCRRESKIKDKICRNERYWGGLTDIDIIFCTKYFNISLIFFKVPVGQ